MINTFLLSNFDKFTKININKLEVIIRVEIVETLNLTIMRVILKLSILLSLCIILLSLCIKRIRFSKVQELT